MGNRIFTVVVLLLWATSMSWLFVAKILPPFFQGEPPRINPLAQKDVVCWRIECADRKVGWAASQVVTGALDSTEIHSRVLMDEIPLREMAPQWMSALVNSLEPIKLDSRSRVALDSLGNLAAFDTRVWINDMPIVVKMHGRVEDDCLRLRIQSGDIKHVGDYPVPNGSFLGSELTPDAKLPQMHLGRRWQKEVYSPFRSPHDSVELVQAEVVAQESIIHENAPKPVKRVDYRSLSSAGVAADDTLRATVWVADDGTVLRQDVYLVNVKLRFERQQSQPALDHATDLLDLKTVASSFSPSTDTSP